eukprot:SAG31_NODE_136_length_23089_cov_8.825924_17_plen_521_part_00
MESNEYAARTTATVYHMLLNSEYRIALSAGRGARAPRRAGASMRTCSTRLGTKMRMAFVGSLTVSCAAGIASPTPQQLAWQQTMLRTFHHFDICTFTGCEHNSGTANKSRGSGPASAFAPTAVNATQWVLAAKAMGAGTAVLTARHEGGFCLWPSKYTEYSIKNSPYKNGRGDVVMEFVTACRTHGIKPGLYIAGGCDAYHHCGPQPVCNASEYQRIQNGMVQELTSGKYGIIEYLWFDHHGNPVNSTSPFGPWCPHMCDPMSDMLWPSIDETVAQFSGAKTLRGGADLNIGATEPPAGDQPLWLTCNTTDGTIHTRPSNGYGPYGKFYRPAEITNMLTTGGWFHHDGSTKPLSHAKALEMIWGANAKGYSFIGNAPPNTNGVLDADIVAMMTKVGDSIRRFWASKVGESSGLCGEDQNTVHLVLPKGLKPGNMQTIALSEDLSNGQQVASYVVELQKEGGHASWETIAQRHTIGRLFLHELNVAHRNQSWAKIRVRCTEVLGARANVSIVALGLNPLSA